jgi:hypothetical protein
MRIKFFEMITTHIKRVRSLFRIIGLLTLIFRLFFIEYVSYYWNVTTYILLAISLVGMIVFELIVYFRKNSL